MRVNTKCINSTRVTSSSFVTKHRAKVTKQDHLLIMRSFVRFVHRSTCLTPSCVYIYKLFIAVISQLLVTGFRKLNYVQTVVVVLAVVFVVLVVVVVQVVILIVVVVGGGERLHRDRSRILALWVSV